MVRRSTLTRKVVGSNPHHDMEALGKASHSLDLQNRVLDLASHSLSDCRWGVSIGQPMRHLLSQIFQQHINSAMRINSHTTYVTELG